MMTGNAIRAAIVAATTGLLLTACSGGSDDESPSASETADGTVNVSTILEQVRSATECSPWVGGKQAGEGILPAYSFTCDAEGDGTVDTSLTVYDSPERRDQDLATVEADYPGAAIIKGDGYLIATTSPDHFAALEGMGGEVLSEIS